MSNVTSIIARFGGVRPMARAVGVAPTCVAYWKRRGAIPSKRRRLVLDAAVARGIALTADELVAADFAAREAA